MGKWQYGHRPKTKAQARAERELRAREKKFELEHADDTDEELMRYLKEIAAAHEGELFKADIPGSNLIGKRFGSWYQALDLAGLPRPKGKREVIGFTRAEQNRMIEAGKRRQREMSALDRQRKLEDAEKRKASERQKEAGEQDAD